MLDWIALAVSLLLGCALAAYARPRLRCWFYSALTVPQAWLAEKSAGLFGRALLVFPLYVRGYFPEGRARLLTLWAGGLTIPLFALLCLIMWGVRPAAAVSAGLCAVLLLVRVTHFFSLKKGTDGRHHEPFNRFAPLDSKDKKQAELAARKTEWTAFGQRALRGGQPAAALPEDEARHLREGFARW